MSLNKHALPQSILTASNDHPYMPTHLKSDLVDGGKNRLWEIVNMTSLVIIHKLEE